MCSAHWQRWSKGQPLEGDIAQRLKSDAERLQAYSAVNESGCHIWIAALANGYGSISSDNGGRLAHRAAWELANGRKLSDSDVVHHTCANRACVNPDHLQCITPQESTAEMRERLSYQRRIAELEAELAKREIQ